MSKEKNLRSLSDSELDDLIEHGINQQETVQRHGSDYQHYLNVVAAAKEEKSRRSGSSADSGADMAKVAENVPDTLVEDNAAPNPLHTAEKGNVEDTREAVAPRNTGGAPIDAEFINQGLPGVQPRMAGTTPENTGLEKGRDAELEPKAPEVPEESKADEAKRVKGAQAESGKPEGKKAK